MEAALGYQKLDPHPKILPLIWACPNRGDDFQLSKATTLPGFQFCCHVDKQLGKWAVSLTWARFFFGGTACFGPVKWLGRRLVEVVDSVAVATTATRCGVRSAETIKV